MIIIHDTENVLFENTDGWVDWQIVKSNDKVENFKSEHRDDII